MMSEPKKARHRAEPAVLERLREAVEKIGSQMAAAEITGVRYATLQRMLAGKSPLDHDRLEAIAKAAQVTVDYILRRTDDPQGKICATSVVQQPQAEAIEFINVPRLKAVASAGNGVVADRETLEQSPFHLAGDWLRKNFGSVNSLRVVLVNGASQEPDLRDGDWVLIDEARNVLEDGLAVIRLDDGLLVKRLQREGHILHLLSKNPEYSPIILDLRQDEGRLKVIGKVIYCFKSI
ncbi:XRE family transcriptional regulator [Novosphingobium sp. KACC 22771]|uniref:XRE family transcriptional regulator n=1 Tax=Novosphingobium sp. KACC 22771 TaxID=3025670 RepID=UPI002365B653|nr:XRE family transcriptional regulator [Novosphingobium sp. KACC 22771]WDF73494.1 XRE family transcriptional regulator [Novosphingobium sp. KACC 22771]